MDNILSSHTLPPLISTLPSHPTPPSLPHPEDLCSLVLKGDGCCLVLSAMRRHKTVSVQHAGLSALCNMAISGETGKQRRPALSVSLYFTQVHPLHCPCSLVKCSAVSVFSVMKRRTQQTVTARSCQKNVGTVNSYTWLLALCFLPCRTNEQP